MKFNLWRTKPIHDLLSEARDQEKLKREMSAADLVALGVGAIIGTGIFVLTGVAAANYAGPGVILSFLISGTAAGLAALVYAELASMIPVAGSAYTYAYASLGEIVAWIIGWNLILEYMVAAGAVALGWSSYFTDILRSAGLHLPFSLTSSPLRGGILDLPAIFITAFATIVALTGPRASAATNKIVVAVKVLVILAFLVLGFPRVNPAHWRPFLPFGLPGVAQGAAIIFFAYIGFDAVSTAAEEVRDPARDLPRGIIGSLALSTLLYMAVAAVLTGLTSYHRLNTASPVTTALLDAGIRGASFLIGVGALAGLTSVLLVGIYAQSRIFLAMGRDGLLPRAFAYVHPKFRTPWVATLLVGAAIALISSLLPIEIIAQLANVGTLSAFIIVSIGVIILRYTRPDLPRPFRVPLAPWLPLLTIAFASYLFLNLPRLTWIRFCIWLILGILIYIFYGYRHSLLANQEQASLKRTPLKIERPPGAPVEPLREPVFALSQLFFRLFSPTRLSLKLRLPRRRS